MLLFYLSLKTSHLVTALTARWECFGRHGLWSWYYSWIQTFYRNSVGNYQKYISKLLPVSNTSAVSRMPNTLYAHNMPNYIVHNVYVPGYINIVHVLGWIVWPLYGFPTSALQSPNSHINLFVLYLANCAGYGNRVRHRATCSMPLNLLIIPSLN